MIGAFGNERRALEDELQLATNPQFLKCMAKEGLGVGGESVVFSTLLTKINKVGKKQPRVLVLTSGAIYSFEEGKYKKSKRRIPLGEVGQPFCFFVFLFWAAAFVH